MPRYVVPPWEVQCKYEAGTSELLRSSKRTASRRRRPRRCRTFPAHQFTEERAFWGALTALVLNVR
jgi:hypothetical protein